jgi:hypothetical protein
MRLYPRYTVERNADQHMFDVVDQIEKKVLDSFGGIGAAYSFAIRKESEVCSECGLEPRAPGTSECVRCYVEGKL